MEKYNGSYNCFEEDMVKYNGSEEEEDLEKYGVRCRDPAAATELVKEAGMEKAEEETISAAKEKAEEEAIPAA